MAYDLSWSPSAQTDLRQISAYIAQDDPEAARRFIQGIFHVIERLQTLPLSGRIVPEFNTPEIREIIRRPCRIVYRISRERKTVKIVRVWHAARGIPEI
jgi:toxin ParE1/3/4